MHARLFKLYYEGSSNYRLEAYVLSDLSPNIVKLDVLVKAYLKKTDKTMKKNDLY